MAESSVPAVASNKQLVSSPYTLRLARLRARRQNWEALGRAAKAGKATHSGIGQPQMMSSSDS